MEKSLKLTSLTYRSWATCMPRRHSSIHCIPFNINKRWVSIIWVNICRPMRKMLIERYAHIDVRCIHAEQSESFNSNLDNARTVGSCQSTILQAMHITRMWCGEFEKWPEKTRCCFVRTKWNKIEQLRILSRAGRVIDNLYRYTLLIAPVCGQSQFVTFSTFFPVLP